MMVAENCKNCNKVSIRKIPTEINTPKSIKLCCGVRKITNAV
jgi:hypothetical protein